jgi:Family of unknown function (DUF6474)
MRRRKAQADGDDAKRSKADMITAKNAKRAIAVGKVLAPVLTPIAMRAAAAARGAWDDRRARRLGVSPGELNNYSGKGGALHARIASIAGSLRELKASSASRASGTHGERSATVERFVAATEPRLVDLTAAVRAAELMPTERRKAAHRAVAAELDRIEPELLRLLGVEDARPPGTRTVIGSPSAGGA